ncbi:MAG: hypothetical protein J5534_06230 [Fibrobacter sp.]|nr:hypothetical protein [Fibrobacter sp.]
MKRIIRNTLLSDFISAAVCLVVGFALVLMYTGCSEDKPVSGGASEEPSVYALKDITIAGRALNLFVSAQTQGSGEKQRLDVLTGAGYAEGTQVNFYSVDSVTFEMSDEPFAQVETDADGNFEISEVSVGSPYAVVEITGHIVLDTENPHLSPHEKESNARLHGEGWDETWATYRTVVDLRETRNVKINVLTTLAAYRILNLAKSGIPFAQAAEMAELDALHSFGIYEPVAPFDSVDFSQKSNSVFPVFVAASYIFSGYPKDVENAANKIGAGEIWVSNVLTTYPGSGMFERDYHLLREPEFLVQLGLDSNDMQIAGLIEKYFFNAVAIIGFQKDRCTAGNQGEQFAYGGAHYMVCDSGYWVLRNREISKTLGMVTDERDGQTYGTFSFEYEGKTWTWMAENLNYEVLDSRCYGNNSAYCETYGREYTIETMFGIERDSVYNNAKATKDSLHGISDSLWRAHQEAFGDDSVAYAEARHAYVLALREADSTYYSVFDASVGRDVCMDGWHVATSDDWENLYNFLIDSGFPYKEESLKSTSWTKGKDGLDVIGFNVLMPPEPAQFIDYFILGKNGEVGLKTKIWSFKATGNYCIRGFGNYIWVDPDEELDPDYTPSEYSKLERAASVRCVKNQTP